MGVGEGEGGVLGTGMAAKRRSCASVMAAGVKCRAAESAAAMCCSQRARGCPRSWMSAKRSRTQGTRRAVARDVAAGACMVG